VFEISSTRSHLVVFNSFTRVHKVFTIELSFPASFWWVKFIFKLQIRCEHLYQSFVVYKHFQHIRKRFHDMMNKGRVGMSWSTRETISIEVNSISTSGCCTLMLTLNTKEEDKLKFYFIFFKQHQIKLKKNQSLKVRFFVFSYQWFFESSLINIMIYTWWIFFLQWNFIFVMNLFFFFSYYQVK
jgi:hypothetical protein